jgi:enoyl-CoA hydratase/carnithine racemase
MPGEPVLFEVRGKTAQIQLNRPENRNSMDSETIPAFRAALERAREVADLRCIIITGSGSTFCAGADFKSQLVESKGRLPNDVLMEVYEGFLKVRELEVPTIAAMNGHAVGGGFGLTLVCDIRIANREAKYGANFARLGLHTGMGISYMLPRLVGVARANELLFTGRLITGAEAAEIGLANYAVSREEVMAKAWDLAREIEISAPMAVRMIKRSVQRGMGWNLRSAAEMEAHCQSRTLEMEDAKEGIAALLEKRTPNFRGR